MRAGIEKAFANFASNIADWREALTHSLRRAFLFSLGPFLARLWVFPRTGSIKREVETGHRYKAKAELLLKRAVETGSDPKLVVPHPDDIIVTVGKGWKMPGPCNQEELDRVLDSCKRRDILIMQAVLEERLATAEEWRSAGDRTEDQPGASAWVMAFWMNMELPERFRLTDFELMRLQTSYTRLSKRELLKAAHLACRRSGYPKPRGWKMLPLSDLRRWFYAVAPIFRKALADIGAGKRIDEYALAKEALDALHKPAAV